MAHPIRRLTRFFAFLALAPAFPLAAEIAEGLVARLKPVVVNIECSTVVGLNGDSQGQSKATGFIVDAKRGIIATNQHVTGSSPVQVKIVFENGQSTEARLLHYDAWHDFGFFQIDPAKLDFPLQQAVLGDSSTLHEQDDVFMIGNNDAQEYSVKFGKMTNLVLDKGSRHSASLQTSFDRAGGSSGSPVFNARGEVVAIHFAGTDTTSFELRIEYLKDALAQLTAGGRVKRGDVGLVLTLKLLSDAEKHFHLPPELAKSVKALRPDLKRMIIVNGRVPRTAAHDQFLPGDLILSVNGEMIGDDLYRFDRIVDSHAGGEVEIEAVRNGRRFKARLAVRDAEAAKATRFVQFAGGVFQEQTPDIRLHGGFESDGVFLGRAEPGSSMSGVSSYTLIEGINGTPTPNLNAFITEVRTLKDKDHIYLLVRNARGADLRAVQVTLDLKFMPLKISRWSQPEQDWVIENN